MKYILFLIISFLLFTSCAHNISVANLKYTKIEKNIKYDKYYFLYFSSDVELIDNLSNRHVGANLRCFFKEEKSNLDGSDFTDYFGYILRTTGDIQLVSKNSYYNYIVEVTFDKKENDNLINSLQKRDFSEIIKLLNTEPNCLNCAVTAVTYLQTTKRYISNTMCLPKSEIIKVMGE